jgi:hypothetical protein
VTSGAERRDPALVRVVIERCDIVERLLRSRALPGPAIP